jgi:hypothetical protein
MFSYYAISLFFPLILFCVLSGAVCLLFMWMSPLGKGSLCILPLDGSAQEASGCESEKRRLIEALHFQFTLCTRHMLFMRPRIHLFFLPILIEHNRY